MPTLLVVADDVGQLLDRLTGTVTLVQQLPPRLAVMEAEDAAGLRGAPGVIAVGDPDLPDDVRAGLSDAERLFADAWVLGRRPKVRPGEGLPWDAPGFEPPDRPR